MKHYLVRLLPLAFIPLGAQAADEPFSADAELGVLITSGNTESTSLKAKLDAKQSLTEWRLNYVLEALYKEDTLEGEDAIEETETTAERYAASLQADYKLNAEQKALFLFGSYEEDRFSGYDYQATLATGYTDRFFKTDSSEFTYSVGVGSSFNRTEDIYDSNGTLVAEGESDSSAIVRIALDYVYNFSEHAKFTQKISSAIAMESDSNTKTRSESALTANLNDTFALKASFLVTHNSEVSPDIENTDTQTGLTIVYSF